MPLAKSRWHQPFFGFWSVKKQVFFHRCQRLFSANWRELNPYFPCLARKNRTEPFLKLLFSKRALKFKIIEYTNSQSLQMMERPLMSPDELKSMSKGSFVVMKTGHHPMKTKLKLFFRWGIQFETPLQICTWSSRVDWERLWLLLRADCTRGYSCNVSMRFNLHGLL